MSWPTSQDYNEAIQNAATSFADPDLKGGEVVLNAIGLPVPRSGNFADVYEFKTADGKKWALKLFTRKVTGLQQRYAKIDEHLSRAQFPFTVGFKYLAEGIRVRGEWYPLLKMEWVEGFTLNEFVRDNAGKPQYLHALMQMWGKLTALLRDADFAHADLQHGNVLLVPATGGRNVGLRLIDYDGMWVPALAETHSGEVGHPNFQHPLRLKDRLYNADVDRFPHLVIASALRATLIGGKPLWEKYDNGDNLLFKENDLHDPPNAAVFKALWDLHDDVLCTLVGKMALATREPLRKTPWLDDVLFEEGGPKLAMEEEKKVMQHLGVGPHFTRTKETAAAVSPAREEFSDFEVVSDNEAPAARRPETKTKKKKKKEEVKSRLPYYIGGGATALLLLVGVIIAASGGKKEPTPTTTEVAKVQPKEEPPKVIPKKPDDPVDVPKPNPINTGDAMIGTWRIDSQGHDAYWTITRDNGQWSVRGVYHRNNVETGSFLGTNVQFLDGTLTLVRKLTKNPANWEDNLACMFRFDQNQMRLSHSPTLGHSWRTLQRSSVPPVGPPPVIAKGGPFSIQRKSGIPSAKNIIAAASTSTPELYLFLIEGEAQVAKTTPQSTLHSLTAAKHEGPVRALATSPDGKICVTGGDDSFVRIWRISDFSAVHAIKEHAQSVIACAVSPDNERAVSIGLDNLLCEWNLKDGKLIRKFAIPAARAVAYLNDGKSVLVGTQNESAGIWNLEQGKKTKDLPNHVGPVHAVCVVPDSDICFTGGEDGIMRLWGLPNGIENAKAQHPKPVVALQVVPGGKYVASAAGNQVNFFDARSGASAGSGTGPPTIRCLAFSPSENHMLIAGSYVTKNPNTGEQEQRGARDSSLYRTDGPAVAKDLNLPNAPAAQIWSVGGPSTAVQFNADNSRLIHQVGSQFRVIDVNNGALVDTWRVDHPVTRFSSYGTGSVVGTYVAMGPPRLFKWDSNGAKVAFHLEDENLSSVIFAVAEKADLIFSLPRTGGLAVYSAKDGKKIDTIAVQGQQSAGYVSCTPDGESLTALLSGTFVYFRSSKDRPMRQIATLTSMNGQMPMPQLAPDGKHFIHYRGSQTIFVHETQNGKRVASLEGHTANVDAVAFMPDGRLVSVGDESLRIWDLAAAKEIGQIRLEPAVSVRNLAVSGDGRLAAVAQGNKTSGSRLTLFDLTKAGTAVAKKDPPMVEPKVEPKVDGAVGTITKMSLGWKAVPGAGLAGVIFSENGERIFVLRPQGLQVLNAKDGSTAENMKVADEPRHAPVIAPENALIFRGPNLTVVWDLVKKTNRFEFPLAATIRPAVNWKDNTILIPKNNNIEIYSLKDGAKVTSLKAPNTTFVSDVACTADGQTIVALGTKSIYLKTAAHQEFREVAEKPQGGSQRVSISRDGKFFAFSRDRDPIKIYAVGDEKAPRSLEGETFQTVESVFSSDGERLIVVAQDNTVRLVDVKSGKLLQSLTGTNLGHRTGVAISPDGRSVLAFGIDGIQQLLLKGAERPPMAKVEPKKEGKANPRSPGSSP